MCTQKTDRTKGVYMLVDTSGTYTEELDKARAIVNYLLGSLAPGDTMAVARIDTGSFSEKGHSSPKSPSTSGRPWPTRKSAPFRSRWPILCQSVAGSSHTDISGGSAAGGGIPERSRNPARNIILIFSDLKEELAKGSRARRALSIGRVQHHRVERDQAAGRYPRSQKLYAAGGSVARQVTESGGGAWRVINDLERLDHLFSL
jgi:hypothetical protein